MREKIKNVLSSLIVIGLVFLLLTILTQIMERKSSYTKNYDFITQDADFDVLFVGSSKVINSVFPMELWDDYGFVSYNLGGHGNTVPTSYWVILNALEYTSPELIVMDCNNYASMDRVNPNLKYMHLSFDAFPLSTNKIKAVYDLIRDTDEQIENVRESRIELLWHFYTYHNRWNELTESDFYPSVNSQKGAEPRIGIAVPKEIPVVSQDKRLKENTTGKEYLIKIIETCKERGIDLLLTYIPFPASEAQLIAANTVYDIAAEYCVDYINFFDEDVVDFSTDCYDANSHLNPSGAQKVTAYLGKYINEHYHIPDQRENPDYEDWYEDSKKYLSEKARKLANRKSLYEYLMLLVDDDFSFVLGIVNTPQLQNEKFFNLLQNLGIDTEQIMEEPCYVVANGATGVIDVVCEKDLICTSVETSLGILSLETYNDGYSLKLNNQKCCTFALDSKEQYDVYTVLFDAYGEKLSESKFNYEE